VLPEGIEYMNISVLESISKLTDPTLNHAAKNQNIIFGMQSLIMPRITKHNQP
jgi:hypothetical protein